MHAGWNALARKSKDPYAFFFSFNLLATIIWSPLAIVLLIEDSVSLGDLGLIVASGSLQVAYFALLAEAYRHGELGVVYPLARGTSVAVVPFAGIIFFSERPTLAGAVGIALTLTGLLLALSDGLRRASQHATPARIFALATGLVIATYSVVDAFGVDRVHPLLYGYGLVAAAVILQAPYVAKFRLASIHAEFRRNLVSVAAGAIFSMATYMLVLFALTSANVGYVVPMREMSIVFAVILGIIFLHEPMSRLRLTAAAIIGIGAVVIAIGG